MLENLAAWGPFLGTLIGSALVLGVTHRLLNRGVGRGFLWQIVALLLLGVTAVALIAVLPVSAEMRGQLLSLLGVVVSGALALSSTTFLGNALAGLMLQAVRNFRPGDFLKVGDHFGRVSERGLFGTELQTEDRNLTTLPNLYLATNPVTVVRASGTIVSAKVSLGYDVSHRSAEKALLEATEQAGLSEGFVQVEELGDFSVVYRVAGLLEEVKTLLSTRSKLRKGMLDALHAAGIEIASPNLMLTRGMAERLAPSDEAEPKVEDSGGPESLAFDKAEDAAKIEQLRDRLEELAQERDETKASLKEAAEGEKASLEKRLEELDRRQERLEQGIEKREEAREEPEKKAP